MRGSIVLSMTLLACGSPGAPPRGRVVRMETPSSEPEARALGCWSSGADAGAGWSALVARAGGFAAYLEPQGAPIRWVIIFEAPGLYGSARQLVSLRIAGGDHLRRDEFEIGPVAAQFGEIWLEEGGWIAGEAAGMQLPALELADAPPLALRVESITLSARLLQDDRGLTMERAVLSGYVSERSFADAFPDAATRERMVGSVGGFDARLDDATEAKSICLLIDVEPAIVHDPPPDGASSP